MIRTHRYIAFQEAYQEDFEYSDFFRDHQLQSQSFETTIGDVRREFICCGLDSGLEKQFKSKSDTTNTRASNPGTKIQNTIKSHKKPHESRFRLFHKSYGEQRQDPGRDCRHLQ